MSIKSRVDKVMIMNKLQFISLTLSKQIHLYKVKTNLFLEVKILVTFGDEGVRY